MTEYPINDRLIIERINTMGKVKQMLMELMDEAIDKIGEYEDFNSWASAYPQLDQEELRELWDEFVFESSH